MISKTRLLAVAAGGIAALSSVGAAAVDAKGDVYGDLRYGLDHSDSRGPVSDSSGVGPDTDFRELNSFVGIKGSTTVDGITAFGAYEFYVDGQLLGGNSRQAYAGVKGGFGTVSFGDMFTAYAKAGIAIDPFYNTSLAGGNGGAPGTSGLVVPPIFVSPGYSSFGQSVLFTPDVPLNVGAFAALPRLGGVKGNQLAYESPSIGGLTINGAVFFDEGDNGSTAGEENHDYAAGLTYEAAGLTVGVQTIFINDEVGTAAFVPAVGFDGMTTRLHASYATDAFGVGFSAERIDDQNGNTGAPDQDLLFLSGWVGVAPGTRVAGSVGVNNEVFDVFTGASAEGVGIQLGVFHDIIPSFTVNAGVAHYDLQDTDFSGSGTVDDTTVLAVGASYKFDLGFAGSMTSR